MGAVAVYTKGPPMKSVYMCKDCNEVAFEERLCCGKSMANIGWFEEVEWEEESLSISL
jgi:hypothetical protein